MEKSDTIDALAKALATVQSQLEGAKKDSSNPFFKMKYATLASAWDACRDLLTANGLSVVQASSVIEGRSFVLDTILLHESGQWISGQLSVPLVKEDPQGLGSAMTYARRYSLMAIVGICPEDDDAEEATKRETAKAPAKPKTEEKGYDVKWYGATYKALGKKNADVLIELAKDYNVTGKTPSEAINNLNGIQEAELHKKLEGLLELL